MTYVREIRFDRLGVLCGGFAVVNTSTSKWIFKCSVTSNECSVRILLNYFSSQCLTQTTSSSCSADNTMLHLDQPTKCTLSWMNLMTELMVVKVCMLRHPPLLRITTPFGCYVHMYVFMCARCQRPKLSVFYCCTNQNLYDDSLVELHIQLSPVPSNLSFICSSWSTAMPLCPRGAHCHRASTCAGATTWVRVRRSEPFALTWINKPKTNKKACTHMWQRMHSTQQKQKERVYIQWAMWMFYFNSNRLSWNCVGLCQICYVFLYSRIRPGTWTDFFLRLPCRWYFKACLRRYECISIWLN